MNLHPSFLVPDATLLLEIVAVLVLFAVLARFVLPRLRAAADARTGQVEAAEEKLRQATAEREASQRVAARQITEARLEAHRILADARNLRDLILSDARERAREEHASILARAGRAVARQIPQTVAASHSTASPGERSFATTTKGHST